MRWQRSRKIRTRITAVSFPLILAFNTHTSTISQTHRYNSFPSNQDHNFRNSWSAQSMTRKTLINITWWITQFQTVDRSMQANDTPILRTCILIISYKKSYCLLLTSKSWSEANKMKKTDITEMNTWISQRKTSTHCSSDYKNNINRNVYVTNQSPHIIISIIARQFFNYHLYYIWCKSYTNIY